MSTLEIIYNTISFIIAAVLTICFTIYSKKTLKTLETEEKGVNAFNFDYGNIHLEKLPTR